MNRTHLLQPSSRLMGNWRSSYAAVGSDDGWCRICVNLGTWIDTIRRNLFCCQYSSQRTSVANACQGSSDGFFLRIYKYKYTFVNTHNSYMIIYSWEMEWDILHIVAHKLSLPAFGWFATCKIICCCLLVQPFPGIVHKFIHLKEACTFQVNSDLSMEGILP